MVASGSDELRVERVNWWLVRRASHRNGSNLEYVQCSYAGPGRGCVSDTIVNSMLVTLRREIEETNAINAKSTERINSGPKIL